MQSSFLKTAVMALLLTGTGAGLVGCNTDATVNAVGNKDAIVGSYARDERNAAEHRRAQSEAIAQEEKNRSTLIQARRRQVAAAQKFQKRQGGGGGGGGSGGGAH